MKAVVSEPEIVRDVPPPNRNRRRLVPVVVLVILAVLVGFAWKRFGTAHAADQTQYKVVAAGPGTVRKTVSATGILQPWSTVDIKSKAGGRVNALLVDVGSVVKNNQVLAKIDPSDTLLSVQTAQAGINGAIAHTQQSQVNYNLQTQQSQIAIANAQDALNAALAGNAASRAQLSAAQQTATAQPLQTQAAIQQAQAAYHQAVQARQLLNATNRQDRAAAQAASDQAVATQKAAKQALDRQSSLAQKGYVAQQTVDTAQASYDVAAAQTSSAQEKLSTLQAQQQANIQAADAKVAQAQAALNQQTSSVDVATKQAALRQAQASLKQSDAQVAQAREALAQAQANQANNAVKSYDVAYSKSQVASNQATLTNAKTALAQTIVRAPTDGIVLQKYVSEGTYITSGISLNSTGTSIVQIGDITRMYVQATVDETDLANIDPGQTVDVSFDAYPGLPFEGTVARIDPQAVVNQNVTQFNVRVEIDNSQPTFRLLKPGMNATCDFIVSKKDDALSVPNEAVQTDDQGSYVQVVTGGTPAPADPTQGTTSDPNTLVDVKLQHRTVETGLAGDDATEITSGLKAGERVVTQTIVPVTPTATTGATSPFGGGNTRGFGGGGGGGGRGGGR